MKILKVNKTEFNKEKINHPYLDEEVAANKYYLLKDRGKIIGGFAFSNLENSKKELQGVFKKSNQVKGLLGKIMDILKNDSLELYCFEVLQKLYKKYGFKIVDSYEFDENLAPKNWNIAKLGRQRVLKMVREV